MRERAPLLILAKTEESLENLRSCVNHHGTVYSTASAEEAQKIVELRAIPVFVIESDAPGNIETLISSIQRSEPHSQCILAFAPAEEELAKRCLKVGACHLMPRPWDAEVLKSAVSRSYEHYEMLLQSKHEKRSTGPISTLALDGVSASIAAVNERITKLVSHDASVHLCSETGCGKERVAHWIHEHGRRRHGNFICLDLSREKSEEHERLLFGEKDGAAVGALELANGGSLYLMHVEALSPKAQETLQGAMKDLEFSRLGSHRAQSLDLRVISSTRSNLRQHVSQERFREDLYWGLCGVVIELPPLRDRPGDIEGLLRLFLEEAKHLFERKTPNLTHTLLKAIRGHHFPGNSSELRHLAGLLAALSESGEASLASLPAQMMVPRKISGNAASASMALKPVVHEFEKQFLVSVLKACNGNQSRAAKVLDIHRNTLILKMQELGIPNKRSRSRLKL